MTGSLPNSMALPPTPAQSMFCRFCLPACPAIRCSTVHLDSLTAERWLAPLRFRGWLQLEYRQHPAGFRLFLISADLSRPGNERSPLVCKRDAAVVAGSAGNDSLLDRLHCCKSQLSKRQGKRPLTELALPVCYPVMRTMITASGCQQTRHGCPWPQRRCSEP